MSAVVAAAQPVAVPKPSPPSPKKAPASPQKPDDKKKRRGRAGRAKKGKKGAEEPAAEEDAVASSFDCSSAIAKVSDSLWVSAVSGARPRRIPFRRRVRGALLPGRRGSSGIYVAARSRIPQGSDRRGIGSVPSSSRRGVAAARGRHGRGAGLSPRVTDPDTASVGSSAASDRRGDEWPRGRGPGTLWPRRGA